MHVLGHLRCADLDGNGLDLLVVDEQRATLLEELLVAQGLDGLEGNDDICAALVCDHGVDLAAHAHHGLDAAATLRHAVDL